MSRMRNLIPAGVALVGALTLLVTACGNDNSTGPGNSVELQVVAGIAFADNKGIFVHVRTPRANVVRPMPSGLQTEYANWTKVKLNLQDGDVLTLSVVGLAADTLMTDKCVVQLDPSDRTYARTILFYFAPPNNYADCADGLVDP